MMSDKTPRIIMLVGIISLLILIPIDLLIDGARPLSLIIAVISLALGVMALRTTLKDKHKK